MGWMQECCRTYDVIMSCKKKKQGDSKESDDKKEELDTSVQSDSERLVANFCPIHFMPQNAQLEVELSADGEFKEAFLVNKGESTTFIPVTEKSASRTSGIAAHPLCDQLSYIALGRPKSYIALEYQKGRRIGAKKVDGFAKYKDPYVKKYAAYLKELKGWAESKDHSHYIVKAVYNYITKGKLIEDLLKKGLIKATRLETDNKVALKEGSINGVKYDKCLVRWRVFLEGNEADCGVSWKDESLAKCYAEYCMSKGGKKDLCYILGKEGVRAEIHPKGVVNRDDSKFISANDTNGLTFRGRFEDAAQAYSVSVEATQKAHAALRWVIDEFGVSVGDRTFVCWNPNLYEVPNPSKLLNIEVDGQEFSDYKDALRNTIGGYENTLKNSQVNHVVIMATEAATTGRRSITYYNELDGSDFLRRIEDWYLTCSWYDKRAINGKRRMVVATPSNVDIVRYAFGTQQGKKVVVNEKLLNNYSQTLLRCIVDSQPLPDAIVSAIVRKASLRTSYDSDNYDKLLSIACALIRKQVKDKSKKECIKMELDLECTDRSYLFGRLLAVAEKVESDARGTSDSSSDRATNAERYQTAFAQKPLHTFKQLDERLLKPYYAKLNPESRQRFKDLVNDIIAALPQQDESALNRPLSDMYLIGYYLQRREFKLKKI